MPSYQYLAFGLRIEAARPISSLIAAKFAGEADVRVIEGKVDIPNDMQDFEWVKVSVLGEECVLNIEECARFQVLGGHTVKIDSDPNATNEQVNLYLLGSVFGVLLHQRRMLPFHCNAVEIEGRAFLFCGESGAGKSTLAAHFIERGFRLLSDDLCALQFVGARQLFAFPGVARLKLWQDTLDIFGRNSAELTLVPWYDDKFEVAFTGEDWDKPRPVCGIYHLRDGESARPLGIHPLKGLKAANCITANIYRRRLGDLMGAAPFYLNATARIMGQVPIFAMNRKWGFAHFREDAIAVEHHLRDILRQSEKPSCDTLESNGFGLQGSH